MNGGRDVRVLWRIVLLGLLTSVILMTATSHGGQDRCSMRTPDSKAFLKSLTAEERAWLRDHPVIRVVQDPGWPPVEFTNERGEPSGMSNDYLRLVEQRLGVKFEQVRNLSWQEAYARLKRREIDMTTSVAVTPERAEFWAFTKPYMRIPIVIATRLDVTYIADLRELAGKKAAVAEGYAVDDWIPRDFPNIRFVRVKTTQEGLKTLQRGEVFAYIDNLLIIGHYQAKMKVTNVKISGQTPYVNAQCMAVRKDWAILAGILDKALDSISVTERNAIYRKWLPTSYEHGFNYTLLWEAFAVFAVILLGLILWIRRLASEIRHRKEAEAASSENARRFRRFFDVAAVPLCLIDKDGVFKDFNDHFVKAFGYTKDDAPTLAGLLRLAYPDHDYRRWVVKTWEAAVHRAQENNTDIEPMEYRVTCKNGEIRTLVITGTYLDDDLLAAFFDITERKQAEEARENALRDWEYIFCAIGQPTLILDPHFRILEANSSAFSATGHSRPEIIGKICYEVFHGTDHPPDDCPLKRLTVSGVFETTEMEVEALGGVYLVSCTPVFDNAAHLVKVIHIAMDITGRKKAEEEISRLNAELEQRVIERTAQLEAANKDLDAFSYSVSHDLRAPLRTVDGYTRILMEGFGPSLTAEGQRLCTAISDSAHAMGKLIDNLLAFSRFGRAAMKPSPVDMAALANSIFLELTSPGQRERIDFIVGPMPRIQGDPMLLRQVWMNLLGNAVKFSSKKERSVIAVSAGPQGNEFVYSIRDNGVGFDMRYADKLFGVFRCLHSSKEFEGTGVGLAIVRRIIERHGGRVWAEGEPGKRAVFYFTINPIPTPTLPLKGRE